MPNGFCMVAVKNGRTVFIMTINVVDLLQEVNAVADLDISDSVKAFDYMGETIAFDDVDYYYTDGDTVELDEAIQTNVIMNIPAQRLCSENCKGLCPVCGADLDTGCCCCSRGENNDKAVDARLAVLKDFFDK